MAFLKSSIDAMSVLFLFICDIIATGNDVSLLEIGNRKNKADDVYDFFVVVISFLISMADWRLYEYFSLLIYYLWWWYTWWFYF